MPPSGRTLHGSAWTCLRVVKQTMARRGVGFARRLQVNVYPSSRFKRMGIYDREHPYPEKLRDKLSRSFSNPIKHCPINIFRPHENRPRLSETPVGAAETRLLGVPQLARSPRFQAKASAWQDSFTFKPPSKRSPHPLARPSSSAPPSTLATGDTHFRPHPAGRASAGPAAGVPSSWACR